MGRKNEPRYFTYVCMCMLQYCIVYTVSMRTHSYRSPTMTRNVRNEDLA